jgi:hypothetical protein
MMTKLIWRLTGRDALKMWVAWHLPRWLVYWATIRLTTWQVQGNPADRPVIEALKAWPWK